MPEALEASPRPSAGQTTWCELLQAAAFMRELSRDEREAAIARMVAQANQRYRLASDAYRHRIAVLIRQLSEGRWPDPTEILLEQ